MRQHDIHVRWTVPGPRVAFSDRANAGRVLSEWMRPAPDPLALVMSLPRGGVPVGRALADALGCDLRPVLVRKLPIPGNPEMGFGAVTIDGTVTLNRGVVAAYGLDTATIERVAGETRTEIVRRSRLYPGGWPLPEMGGRRVFLVDDGLATGFSAIAAIRMIRAGDPSRLRSRRSVQLGRLRSSVEPRSGRSLVRHRADGPVTRSRSFTLTSTR